MKPITRFIAAIAVAACGAHAFAQQAPTPAASQPDAVATTPETAREANSKAIKRADTATVVKTGPTVADRARQAGDKVEAKVDGMTNSDGTPVATDGTRRTARDVALAPRADRN